MISRLLFCAELHLWKFEFKFNLLFVKISTLDQAKREEMEVAHQ